MEASSNAPSGANKPAPSLFTLAFDVKDAAHALAWLELVRNDATDLIALAREGARRPKHRVLSRGEIRKQTKEAGRKLLGLLSEAEAALSSRGGAG